MQQLMSALLKLSQDCTICQVTASGSSVAQQTKTTIALDTVLYAVSQLVCRLFAIKIVL